MAKHIIDQIFPLQPAMELFAQIEAASRRTPAACRVRPNLEDYRSEGKGHWFSRRRRELSFTWDLLRYEHQQLKDERRYGEGDAIVGTTKLKGRLARQVKQLTRRLRADFAGMEESL